MHGAARKGGGLSGSPSRTRSSSWEGSSGRPGPATVGRAGLLAGRDLLAQALNHRFREDGIGYQYIESMLIRVDSQYLHAEAVKPALSLLSSAGFEGAQEEF